ncbi:hypothetical protein [Curtobacterium sp. MCSS17_016]|uniref:hypothetical protein n=1 Tax=Curtobacterium sp. MCSS17_016 TaxID=2175644 RepID=UPI0011B3604F|nr:hypothetical protein [Curtobacterium sp. MCSS17_016]WIE81208.1 hypothetical protein DEJ19_018415 [Curtobacterium sp. MCSS17_016]
MPTTPIYDRLYRRWLRTVHARATVFPETLNDRERDLLTCADLFWGARWWQGDAGAVAAA